MARRAVWDSLSCALRLALAAAETAEEERTVRRSRQERSDPTAQQSARISGTTPSGCADAPPHEIKIKSRTSALSKVGGLLSQLPSLGVEGGRSKVVVVLQDGQKTKVRTKTAKANPPRSSKPPAQQPTRNSGTTPSGCADAPHGRNQDQEEKPRSRRNKTGVLTRMAARVARNSSVNCLSAAAWLWSRVRTSCAATFTTAVRSEEHTSELQSQN